VEDSHDQLDLARLNDASLDGRFRILNSPRSKTSCGSVAFWGSCDWLLGRIAARSLSCRRFGRPRGVFCAGILLGIASKCAKGKKQRDQATAAHMSLRAETWLLSFITYARLKKFVQK